MRILMSEWQLQLKFENGEDIIGRVALLILCERRQRALKSFKITKVNGVEPIELAKFGVDCSKYAS